MSKLYFRHGTMNSGKSLQLLTVAHNYETQKKNILLFKSATDTRSRTGKIESRTGLSKDCIDITNEFKIIEYVKEQHAKKKIDCILVDEAQFLSLEHVLEFVEIVDELSIPVICYGLKNSYVNKEIFKAAKMLIYHADKVEEIKTVCQFCKRKATHNLYVVNGIPQYYGEVVQVGDVEENKDNARYVSVCRKHYFNPYDL